MSTTSVTITGLISDNDYMQNTWNVTNILSNTKMNIFAKIKNSRQLWYLIMNNVHSSNPWFIFTIYTNPKSIDIPSSACSGTKNPVQRARSLWCLVLRTKGGIGCSVYMYMHARNAGSVYAWPPHSIQQAGSGVAWVWDYDFNPFCILDTSVWAL